MSPFLIPIVMFITAGAVAIFTPLVRAYARKMDRQSNTAVPEHVMASLERMEQSIEAMAEQVERIAEGQRFTTRRLCRQFRQFRQFHRYRRYLRSHQSRRVNSIPEPTSRRSRTSHRRFRKFSASWGSRWCVASLVSRWRAPLRGGLTVAAQHLLPHHVKSSHDSNQSNKPLNRSRLKWSASAKDNALQHAYCQSARTKPHQISLQPANRFP